MTQFVKICRNHEIYTNTFLCDKSFNDIDSTDYDIYDNITQHYFFVFHFIIRLRTNFLKNPANLAQNVLFWGLLQ